MAFLGDARARIRRLPEGDPLRITLEYLNENAVGWQNAVPIDEVRAHLATQGHEMSKSQFQQTILKDTREGTIFIGVAHGKGIYLIETRADAAKTKEFYDSRIGAELAHLGNLERLVEDQGWEPL